MQEVKIKAPKKVLSRQEKKKRDKVGPRTKFCVHSTSAAQQRASMHAHRQERAATHECRSACCIHYVYRACVQQELMCSSCVLQVRAMKKARGEELSDTDEDE